MGKLVLAIGGPRHLEWVKDMGKIFKTLVPMIPKFQALDEPLDIDLYLESFKSETVSYYKQTLADVTTGARKEVYVVGNMSMREADAELRDYLVKQFINMEDVTD